MVKNLNNFSCPGDLGIQDEGKPLLGPKVLSM